LWTARWRDIHRRGGQGGAVSARRGYPSDLTDAQWALIEPLLPEPNTDGRREKHPRREIVNAILYVVRSGCPWRYLPADLPPWQTVYWYFTRWEEAGVTEKLLATLRIKARVQQGRQPEPSAGIIDSQSVKGADTVGRDSRGYDAGKKINGRKRFIITDTLGLLVTVTVLAASWQDRDGAKTALLSAYMVTRRTSRPGRGNQRCTASLPRCVLDRCGSHLPPRRGRTANSSTRNGRHLAAAQSMGRNRACVDRGHHHRHLADNGGPSGTAR
jgi:transposase